MKSFIANIINLFILFTFIAISVQAKELNDKELRCLALNIYHEARSEPPVGRYAVAWVTLNRVEHEKFRDTVCKVVYQPGQFSWTEDGKRDKTYEKEAYKISMKIAEDVYFAKEKGKIDPTGGATFYHAEYVKPKWRHSMSSSLKIGKHIFYTSVSYTHLTLPTKRIV